MSWIKPFCLLSLVSMTSCVLRNKMTFYPDKTSEIPAQNISEYVAEIYLQTCDGETIQTFLFNHADKEKRTLVIYFHGNAGNLYHRIDNAEAIYSMNNNVLLVSYRGYAKSTGKPSEKGIYQDGEAAIKYAKEFLGYSENEIVIFGRSLGTTVAVHNSQNRNFKGVILVTPLTSGKGMAKAMGLGFIKIIAGNSYNSLEKINNLQSPILIIHGTKDNVVPYNMGKELYESYNGEKEIVTIKNGGHNNLQDLDSNTYWGAIKLFLE